MMMAKIVLCLVLCVVVAAGHKHHPKFPKNTEDYIIPMPRKGEYFYFSFFYTKMTCS